MYGSSKDIDQEFVCGAVGDVWRAQSCVEGHAKRRRRQYEGTHVKRAQDTSECEDVEDEHVLNHCRKESATTLNTKGVKVKTVWSRRALVLQ